MSKKKIAGSPVDPTLPHTDIKIDGKTYSLVFTLGALAEGEAALNAAGHNVNLLAALPQLNLSNTRIIFACSLHTFHPEIDFDTAIGMVTYSNVYTIASAIAEAWQKALPEPEAESPNVAAAE